jgi:hypothetical protein
MLDVVLGKFLFPSNMILSLNRESLDIDISIEIIAYLKM